MSAENILKVAEKSKDSAKKYVKEGNFGRAFSHYLVTLKLKPEWKPILEEEFLKILCKWGSILDDKERFKDLFTCYEQAIEIFPNNKVILNNLGAHLLRCGLLREAAHYFRLCLSIDRHYLRAARNLENVSNLAVERWHFRMLNDQHRNEAYREAIIKKIQQGHDTVLDLGTGTGILSLFSSEGPAKAIYACDSSPVMIEMAEKIIRSNNAAGIKLLNKHSTDLRVPEDISERVSLLITETFDGGLLGEDILSTLAHAWEKLLLPASQTCVRRGLVVPFGATMYLTGIELDCVSNAIHLKSGGFYDYVQCNICQSCQGYDTQDLRVTPFKYLTNVEKVVTINFNSPKMINEILEGQHAREMVVKCTRPGRLDCFAVWFDLILDEDIVINTGPESETSCAWDQAVFALPRSKLVRTDEGVLVKTSFEGGKLNIELRADGGDQFEASEHAMNILNDERLVNELHELAAKVRFSSSVRLLDCFPFPVFGLSFLISRREHFSDELVCFAQSEKDRQVIEFIANKFGVRVNCTVATNFERLEAEKFDVILLDLIETAGDLKDGTLLHLDYLKSLLNPCGTLLPHKVTIMGQLIHSDWLMKASRVMNDDVTCGYNVGEFINAYQVSHFIDLDLRTLEKTCCSEPFELWNLLEDTEMVTHMTVPCLSSGCSPNALTYWFRIIFLEGCDEFVTTEATSGYHQAAFLPRETMILNEATFNVVRNDGLFGLEFIPS